MYVVSIKNTKKHVNERCGKIIGNMIGFGIFTFIVGWMVRMYYEQNKKSKDFECPFKNCKWENDSLINIFKHMEIVHKVKAKFEG